MFKFGLSIIVGLFSLSLQANPIVVLEKNNTLVLRGEVNPASMGKVTSDLYNLNKTLPKGQPIYLVLNTPGGSVAAGLDFIRFAKSLDREIKTITISASSMGFVIVQNLGERLILEDGRLMQHRASTQIGGQIPGEITSRLNSIKDAIEILEKQQAKRLKMSLAAYQDMIHDEFYVLGETAVNKGVADTVVDIKCGESLSGVSQQTAQILIFTFTATFSDCPLVTTPIEVKASSNSPLSANDLHKQFKTAQKRFMQLFYIQPEILDIRYIYGK